MGSTNGAWISSLGGVTSVDTVIVRYLTSSSANLELQGAAPLASSFPSPPPRDAALQDPKRRENSCPPARDHALMRPRPSYLSLRHYDSSPTTSSSKSHKATARRTSILRVDAENPTRQTQRLGSADDSSNEPLEQLSPVDYIFPFQQSSPQRGRFAVDNHNSPNRSATDTLRSFYGNPRCTERQGRASWQRPFIASGLPTSYHHDHHRRQSSTISTSSRVSSDLSLSSQTQLAPASRQSQPAQTVRCGGLDSHRASPILLPSPPLRFDKIQKHAWPRDVASALGTHHKPVRSATTSTASPSILLRKAASSGNIGHSLGQAHPYSAQTDPVWIKKGTQPPRSTSMQGGVAYNPSQSFRADSLGKRRAPDESAPRRSSTRFISDPQHVVFMHPGEAEGVEDLGHQHDARRTGGGTRSGQSSRTPFLTTELVYTLRYLEPYNSCEAILMPKPRLRSHSMGTAPGLVVEQVHAAPERFWQRDSAPLGGDVAHVTRSNAITSSNTRYDRARRQSEYPELAALSGRDSRFALHESLPPPLPPKETALPSSGLLPVKSLPPTPTQLRAPATPTQLRSPADVSNEGRDSSDSMENLESPELLERNREIERDREAWRRHHRSSLGASAAPLLGRLSPCLQDPSFEASLSKKRSEGAFSEGMHDSDEGPIRVHRVKSNGGTEQTFLVVHSQPKHPYSNGKLSVSSPDLLGSQSFGNRRRPLVQSLAARVSSFRNRSTGQDRRRDTFHELTQEKDHRQILPQGPVASNAEVVASPRSAIDEGRALGRDRNLVSDETVIIGKPITPKEGNGMPPLARDRTSRAAEGRVDVPTNEATDRPVRRMPMSYKPAGTRDEIKARLADQSRLFTIDPGSSSSVWGDTTALGGALIHHWPGSGRSRVRPSDLPSSESWSCSDSNCSNSSCADRSLAAAMSSSESGLDEDRADHLSRQQHDTERRMRASSGDVEETSDAVPGMRQQAVHRSQRLGTASSDNQRRAP